MKDKKLTTREGEFTGPKGKWLSWRNARDRQIARGPRRYKTVNDRKEKSDE